MRRHRDWVVRFQQVFYARLEAPFEAGVHDCASAVAAIVEAMTGVDIVAGLTASKVKAGGGLRRVVKRRAKVLGVEPIDPRFAQRGDVLVVEHSNGRSLAIIDLSGTHFLIAGDVGWQAYELRNAIEAGAVLDAYGIGR